MAILWLFCIFSAKCDCNRFFLSLHLVLETTIYFVTDFLCYYDMSWMQFKCNWPLRYFHRLNSKLPSYSTTNSLSQPLLKWLKCSNSSTDLNCQYHINTSGIKQQIYHFLRKISVFISRCAWHLMVIRIWFDDSRNSSNATGCIVFHDVVFILVILQWRLIQS